MLLELKGCGGAAPLELRQLKGDDSRGTAPADYSPGNSPGAHDPPDMVSSWDDKPGAEVRSPGAPAASSAGHTEDPASTSTAVDEIEEDEPEHCCSWAAQQETCVLILEHQVTQTILVFFTFVCLFLSDINVYLPLETDIFCEKALLVSMILFFFEWLGNTIYNREYVFSLFFYLDLMATLSLVPDIKSLDTALFGTEDEAETARSLCFLADTDYGSGSWAGTNDLNRGVDPAFAAAARVARAGRAARLGAKAARLVRVLRVLRALRVFKLFKFFGKFGAGKHDNSELAIRQNPTRLGMRMAELASQRVIVIVLTIFIGTSLVIGLTELIDNGPSMGLELLDHFFTEGNVRKFMTNMEDNEFKILCLVKVDENITSIGWRTANEDLRLRRSSGVEIYWSDSKESFLVVDAYEFSRVAAASNMCLVFVILIILLGASYIFTKDAEVMVIAPIAAIVNSVNNINKTLRLLSKGDDHENHDMETDMIDVIITKMAHLLQISFGEAGNVIISQNLASSGELQPMLKGNHVTAVFGFCDIRKFTDTTEVLRGEVMPFVNYVASMVHKIVDDFEGSPNRNIGDAFLCVWKVETFTGKHKSGIDLADDDDDAIAAGQLSPRILRRLSLNPSQMREAMANSTEGSPIADYSQTAHSPTSTATNQNQKASDALISFVRIIEAISSPETDAHLRMYYPLLFKVYPEYVLRLGFGLHYGWYVTPGHRCILSFFSAITVSY